MEIDDLMDQVLKLKEKEIEQKVWELWLVEYPRMTEGNYVSFDEMLNKAKNIEIIENKPINGCYVDQMFF